MPSHDELLILLPSGARLHVGSGLFRPGTDTLALSRFARLNGCRHLVDLGCGCGAFPLLLAPVQPRMRITGIELDPRAADYARQNVQAAGLSERVCIVCADLCQAPLPSGCADAVIANPPYFAAGSGALPRPELAAARTEQRCSCQALAQTAARLLQTGGRFFMLWRPERLAELFAALCAAGLEPKRMQAARGRQVRFVMVEARRGAKPGLQWEPDLPLAASGSQQTAACEKSSLVL